MVDPRKALGLSQSMAFWLLAIVPMLGSVAWLAVSPDAGEIAQPGPVTVPVIAVLVVGGLAGVLAPAFLDWFGRRVARRWAADGHRGDDRIPAPMAVPAAASGTPAAAQGTFAIWNRFFLVSVTGSALPEIPLLAGFMATIATSRWELMAVAIVIYAIVWAVDFPRRSRWDAWAASAGLVLPWDDPATAVAADAGASAPAVPGPDERTAPSQSGTVPPPL